MITFRDLIDLAIGSPESGHVNFYALHVLLSGYAKKLDILDDYLEHDDLLITSVKSDSGKQHKTPKYQRITAGADNPEDEQPAAEEGAPDVDAPAPAEAEAPAAMEAPAEEETPDAAAAAEAEEPVEAAPTLDASPSAGIAITTAEPPPDLAQPSAIGIVEKSAPSDAALSKQQSAGPPQSMHTISKTISGAGKDAVSLIKLENRISAVESKASTLPEDLIRSFGTMTDQINLAVEQLNNVTHLLLDRKPDPQRVQQIRDLALKLRVAQRIAGDEVSLSWASVDHSEDERIGDVHVEEEEEQRSQTSKVSEKEHIKIEEEQTLDLEQHICYTQEKMLDELLELKSDFCTLTNKVNDLSAALLKQDCQRIMRMMQEAQEQMRELKLANSGMREAYENATLKINNALDELLGLRKGLNQLEQLKIDKSEIEILLADKVDYAQLQTKVSNEQLDDFKFRLEKQFCEVRSIISTNEKNILHLIDNLRTSLGLDMLEESLRFFREKIEKDVAGLAETLRKYIDATNDDCAAAAGRVKVLQDLACLSCDTTCVMRTVERSKVGKLPTAHATSIMSPLITYELGSIRKSGIMGYYRKDEFPHTTDAWMSHQSKAPMKHCVPRHAGGAHTINTAKERVEKVHMAKKGTMVLK